MSDAEWFLPIAKPRPNMLPTAFVRFDWDRRTGLTGYEHVPVLAAPVHRDAIAAPMSAEARAVLEAAERFGRGECDSTMLKHAACDYADTLTPPDPLEEARKALMELGRAHGIGSEDDAFRDLSAALDRMKKDTAA